MDNFSPRTSLDKLNPQHELDELLKISWISIYLQEMMKVLYTEDTVANLKDKDISPGKWINILNEKIFFQTSKDKAACSYDFLFGNLWFSFVTAIKNMRDSTGDTRNAGVRCLRISPDGQTLATGDRSGNVR